MRTLAYVLLLALLIPVSGCAEERRWTEAVDLGDGKAIEVSRYAKFSESNSAAGDAYSSTEIESTLEFNGELSDLPIWNVPLVPILLYHDATVGEWVIVATTSNCDIWYERGSPVPMYWEYRLKADKWTRSELSKASLGRKTNLFFDYEPGLPARKISIVEKERVLQSQPFAKDYLSIDPAAKGCMTRVN